MIKIINGNIFDSNAEFIVHQVNCQGGTIDSNITSQVVQKFPHVEVEYRKYLRYCKKNNINSLGTVQYIPTEVWAIGLVDTMKNDRLEVCSDYQYIVNLFSCNEYETNFNAFKKALLDIKVKAQSIGATVAIPYNIGVYKSSTEWSDVYNIIKDVFQESNIDVEIWKLDLR